MAWIRTDTRKDGTHAYRVYFRQRGRQTTLTFDDENLAETFRTAVDQLGAEAALRLHQIDRQPRAQHGITVTEWLTHHIDHLTGVDSRTADDYRAYLRNDIGPALGHMPLADLDRDDVARWVQAMGAAGASAKTIANKHGLLSAALAGAVISGQIPSNPAAGTRLPRGQRQEMVFLTRQQFATLLAAAPERWRPLVEFLVASGARWSEVTALQPADVDRAGHTVRINKAWKRSPYRIGPPKTRRSVRTINVPARVLDQLDYTGEWLFTNPGRGNRAAGGPVRAPNFRSNVWIPAVERSKLEPRPRIHDLRHTCASWLIQAGVPLPVIQRHLGHESIQTTVDVYGHLDRRSAKEAADVLDQALGG